MRRPDTERSRGHTQTQQSRRSITYPKPAAPLLRSLPCNQRRNASGRQGTNPRAHTIEDCVSKNWSRESGMYGESEQVQTFAHCQVTTALRDRTSATDHGEKHLDRECPARASRYGPLHFIPWLRKSLMLLHRPSYPRGDTGHAPRIPISRPQLPTGTLDRSCHVRGAIYTGHHRIQCLRESE